MVAVVVIPLIPLWLMRSPYLWISFVALIALFLGLLVLTFAMRCLRCKGRLGRLGLRYLCAVSSYRGSNPVVVQAEEIGACPHCGIRLDDDHAAALRLGSQHSLEAPYRGVSFSQRGTLKA